ncbi:MAG TPA: ROK family protein [Solirubrobacterales bacterium]|nr:ROK family protein [Solirubrobacterales bacterium]
MNRLNEFAPSSGHDKPPIYTVSPQTAQLPQHVVEELNGLPGPRPQVVMLGPQGGMAVGVEIGRAHLSVGVGDANGCLLGKPEILEEEHVIDGVSPQRTFSKVARMVDEQLQRCDVAAADIRGVGVAIPGPIGHDGQTLAHGITTSYHDIDIPAKLERQLSDMVGIEAEVFVENDVDILARGEQRYGKGYGLRDFLVVKYSGGIGAGIVAGGELVRGRRGGGAGEIGHCTVSPEALVSPAKTLRQVREPRCKCGGWSHLEAFAGGDAIVRHILELEGGGRTSLNRDAPPPAQLDEAMELARAGHPLYAEAIMDAAAMVGYGINTLIHLFNPERVLICGKLSEMGQPFLRAIVEECQDLGLLFGDAKQIVELGAGSDVQERRRISVGGAVTTALQKTTPRFAYSF